MPTTVEEPIDFESLIVQHVNLARSIAKIYQRPTIEDEDLLQVALLAVVNAAHRFEPERGAFASYASVCIHGELKRYLRDKTWNLRPSREIQALVGELGKLGYSQGQATNLLERESLARDLDCTPAQISEALGAGDNRVHSIEVHGRGDGDITDHADGEPADFHRLEERIDMWRALRLLPTEDRQLVRLYYFEDLSQDQVAQRVGLSQMTVSRRIGRLLDQMRSTLMPQSGATA